MVFSGLSTAWRLASWPTNRSPVLVKPTTEGVSRLPSLLMITVGLPPSITATTEFVVPKSIPIAFAITITSFWKLIKMHGPDAAVAGKELSRPCRKGTLTTLGRYINVVLYFRHSRRGPGPALRLLL